jgi:hypothetical protein
MTKGQNGDAADTRFIAALKTGFVKFHYSIQ